MADIDKIKMPVIDNAMQWTGTTMPPSEAGIRDWFAMESLKMVLVFQFIESRQALVVDTGPSVADAVRQSYRMADAMMAERHARDDCK